MIALSLARPNEEDRYEAQRAHLGHVSCQPGDRVGGDIAPAQELDTKWLVGTWRAVNAASVAPGRLDQWELVAREDATFTGEVQSQNGGLLTLSGTYKVAGETVTFEALIKSGSPTTRGQKYWLNLKRNGQELVGTVVRSWTGNTTRISLTRAK